MKKLHDVMDEKEGGARYHFARYSHCANCDAYYQM